MAQLAIKGHATRGEEVIELLEMLGGNNRHKHDGYNSRCVYYVNEPYNNHIICSNGCRDSIAFTLEEFLKKFPYKVGDKVLINEEIKDFHTINSMVWDTDLDRVAYKIGGIDAIMDGHSDTGFWYAGELERYSEQKEETMEKEISGAIIDRFICLEGYDFYDDKGNIIDTKEITMKKKHPKYPKTYEECCEIMGIKYPVVGGKPDGLGASTYRITEIRPFIYLLICRDAYWKIANWKFNYDEKCYYLCPEFGKIQEYEGVCDCNAILAFPTKEMRDAFYDNFEELIEECKELL